MIQPTERRVVCWFSCGVTSAIAAKCAQEDYPEHDIRVVYTDPGSEDADNLRFLHDCEEWLDQDIEIIRSKKYTDTWDVFKKTGWLVGPGGARCTTELKKRPRMDYQRPDDIQIMGFDSSEVKRAERFKVNNIEVDLRTPLIERGWSKAHCADIAHAAGLRLPRMYTLKPHGAAHANCPACPKAGMGHWDRIVRTHFPDQYIRMSRIERELDVSILKRETGEFDDDGKAITERVFLDELQPGSGRDPAEEPAFECGLFCGENEMSVDEGETA